MAKQEISRPENTEAEDVHVILKPVLGVKPRDYILVVYGLILAVILFFALLVPGLRKNGTTFRFSSVPSNAAVFIDGSYAGATPLEVFVEKGERAFRVERNSFVPVERSKLVRGRLIGSLFFPRRRNLDVTLNVEDVEAYLQAAFGRLSEWALVDRFGRSYQPPSLIAEPLLSLYAVSSGSRISLAVGEFIDHALANVSNERMLADLFGGILAYGADGGALTPAGMLSAVNKIIHIKTEYPNYPFLVAEIASRMSGDDILSSEWLTQFVIRYGAALRETAPPEPVTPPHVRVGGIDFVELPGGTFIQGRMGGTGGWLVHPFPSAADPVLMQRTEVTVNMFRDFVVENPRWDPANKRALMDDGLVSEQYLRDWGDEDAPVQYVSYYAAEAYCDWFTEKIGSAQGGYRARLPYEREWEWAASVTGADAREAFNRPIMEPDATGIRAGIQHLMGNMWQWTATWYFPAGYFVTGGDPAGRSVAGDAWATDRFAGAERVVRGGSWANSVMDGIGASTRGSQPPQWSTRFTGFRMVLEPAFP